MLDRAPSAPKALQAALGNLSTTVFLCGEPCAVSDPWYGFPVIEVVPEVSRCLAEREFNKAFPLLNELARDGNAWARSRLGVGLFLGVDFQRDQLRGLKWLTLAAEQGDPGACSFLATTYGVQADLQDDDKAEYYAERALLCGINVLTGEHPPNGASFSQTHDT